MAKPMPPAAPVMSGVGLAALAANVASVFILLRWRDGDDIGRGVPVRLRTLGVASLGNHAGRGSRLAGEIALVFRRVVLDSE